MYCTFQKLNKLGSGYSMFRPDKRLAGFKHRRNSIQKHSKTSYLEAYVVLPCKNTFICNILMTYNNSNFLYVKYLNILFTWVNGQMSCGSFIACVYAVLKKRSWSLHGKNVRVLNHLSAVFSIMDSWQWEFLGNLVEINPQSLVLHNGCWAFQINHRINMSHYHGPPKQLGVKYIVQEHNGSCQRKGRNVNRLESIGTKSTSPVALQDSGEVPPVQCVTLTHRCRKV